MRKGIEREQGRGVPVTYRGQLHIINRPIALTAAIPPCPSEQGENIPQSEGLNEMYMRTHPCSLVQAGFNDSCSSRALRCCPQLHNLSLRRDGG